MCKTVLEGGAAPTSWVPTKVEVRRPGATEVKAWAEVAARASVVTKVNRTMAN